MEILGKGRKINSGGDWISTKTKISRRLMSMNVREEDIETARQGVSRRLISRIDKQHKFESPKCINTHWN